MTELRITGAEQLRKLSADLSAAGLQGKRLRARMGRNMRVTSRPVVAEVKANLRTIPTTGSKHTGLRRALANATRARVRTGGRLLGVSIIVDGKKMPPGQQGLPPRMEGEERLRDIRWRHPVYGNTTVWVQQASHPTVWPTVEKKLPAFRGALVDAITETAEALERGGA